MGGGGGGGDDKRAAGVKRPPMRSSIACLRCRKSKIKCDNDGGSAPCDTCIKQGKECRYPDILPAPAKRPDPPTTIKTERDGGPDRKRLRKFVEDTSRLENHAALYADEVLSAHYLTETLWLQVFELYKLHFATELPFLHMPTLKEKMGSRYKAAQKETDTNLVLLGVLTLTARFHQDLVKYVAHTTTNQVGNVKLRPMQARPDSSAASEYFAEALTKALGPLRTSMTMASVERVQAFLMLGLYEWSQSRPNIGGLSAWMYIGVAIRMAQALGLGFGDKPDKAKSPQHRTVKPNCAAPHADLMITREIKRRTMFSCLILDRMLACGKERVATIRSEDLQIQLPCTEVAFDLSEDVRTGFLKPPGPGGELPPNPNGSVLGRFVRLVDIWGEVSKFSFAGGRFTQREPPWDERTTFRRLREALDVFYSELPPTFTLSTSNYHKHENHQASSVYVALHMLGSVCQIMLHREYIPFIPIRCGRPVGPLDEPTFPEPHYTVPEGFWEASAEQVFRPARDIIELVEICRDKLPMSALVLFSVWTAAFVGIYAWHFPHMDQKGHMLYHDYAAAEDGGGGGGDDDSGDDQQGHPSPLPAAAAAAAAAAGEQPDITKVGPTGTAYQTLARMSSWLNMAGQYVSTFRDMDRYYELVKIDYDRHVGKNQFLRGRAADGNKLSIRLGGDGGGLEEWRVQGSRITDNGTILAAAAGDGGAGGSGGKHLHGGAGAGAGGGYEGSSDRSRSRASTAERGSSAGPDSSSYNTTTVASGASYTDRVTQRSSSMSFTAINSGSMAPSSPAALHRHNSEQLHRPPPPLPPASASQPHPEPRHDGLPHYGGGGVADGSAWNAARYAAAAAAAADPHQHQHQHQHPHQHQHQQHDGPFATPGAGGPMDLGGYYPYNGKFMTFLGENEMMRWEDAASDLQGFSQGEVLAPAAFEAFSAYMGHGMLQ